MTEFGAVRSAVRKRVTQFGSSGGYRYTPEPNRTGQHRITEITVLGRAADWSLAIKQKGLAGFSCSPYSSLRHALLNYPASRGDVPLLAWSREAIKPRFSGEESNAANSALLYVGPEVDPLPEAMTR